MKSLILLVMATIVFGFVFSADLLAGEKELEERLVKEGWVKLTAKELKAMTNYTGSNDYGWAYYIDPSGTKFVTRAPNGNISKGRREITADGHYCYHFDTGPVSCRFLWKRGNVYLNLSMEGKGTIFTELYNQAWKHGKSKSELGNTQRAITFLHHSGGLRIE